MSYLDQLSSQRIGSLRALLRLLRRFEVIQGFRIELDILHGRYDHINMSAIDSVVFQVYLEYPSEEDESIDRVSQILERIFFSDQHKAGYFAEDFDD